MKLTNEAGWDRIVRVIVGAVILYLGWGGVVSGGWGTFFKIFGFIPLLTGIFGVCLLYMPFKFRTNKGEEAPAAAAAAPAAPAVETVAPPAAEPVPPEPMTPESGSGEAEGEETP
jgi:hypothetical protein